MVTRAKDIAALTLSDEPRYRKKWHGLLGVWAERLPLTFRHPDADKCAMCTPELWDYYRRAAMKMLGLVSLLLLTPLPATASVLTATWDDHTGGTSSTRLERRSGTDPYAGLVTVAPGVVLYADPTVMAGTTYCYRAQALVVAGYSNEACATVGALAVVALNLVNAVTGEALPAYAPLMAGDVIDLATVGTATLAIRAATLPALVGSVLFAFDGFVTIDNDAPYDRPSIAALGSHILAATPYSLADAQGAAGTPLSLTFSVVDTAAPPPSSYALTVSVQGPGTVTGPGIACKTDCTESYSSGVVVVLTAHPGKQAWVQFQGWTGACTGTLPTCTVTMTLAQAVGASFGH